MAEIDLGKIQPLWRGEFTGSPATNYEPLDNVGYLDTVYICILEADGSQLPTNTTYFKPLIDLTTYKLQSVIAFVVSQYAGGDSAVVAPISAGLPLLAYDWFVDTNTLQVFSKNGATGTFSDPLVFDPTDGTDTGISGSLKEKSQSTQLDLSNFAHFQDQKPTGTDGGGSSPGKQTRLLNTTVMNSIEGCSLSVNEVTLEAGNYYAEFVAPCATSGRFSHVLIDSLENEYVRSTNGFIQALQPVGAQSVGSGFFTLTAPTAIRIEAYIENAIGVSGLGYSNSAWGVETYTDLKIWRVS